MTSQPYIIQLNNTSGTTYSDIVLFDSFNTMNAANFGLPSDIEVSSPISGVSYKQLLFQTVNMPFIVGLTYLTSTLSAQISQSFSIKAVDANGNQQVIPCSPVKNQYQEQNTVLQTGHQYLLNGYTSYIVSNLLGNCTAKIYIYPSKISSLSNSLY